MNLRLKLIVPFGLLILAVAYLSNNVSTIVNAVRDQLPAAFALARQIVWELDEEIPNVGGDVNAPLMQLKLSIKDIAHFNNLYRKLEEPSYGEKYYIEHNKWRKAEIRFKEKNYKIKIKSQGRSPDSHRKGRFISYAIMVRGDETINGVSRFNLVIREKIQPQRHINRLLAKELGLIYQRVDPIRLKINNWEEKLYFWEDRLTSDLMEVRHNSSFVFFKSEPLEGVTTDKSLLIGRDGVGNFDEKAQRKKFVKMFDDFEVLEQDRKGIFDRYLSINKSILNSDFAKFEQYFNIDYISAYEAARFMMGFIGHGAIEGNLYAAINFSDGKFYPIIVRDNVQRTISLEGDESIELKLESFVDDPIPFLRMLSRNDLIRQRKYLKAYEFIQNNRSFLKQQEELYESYEGLFYRGWVTQKVRQLLGMPFPGVYPKNSKTILAYLEKSEPVYSILAKHGEWFIKVEPNSMSALRIDNIYLEKSGGIANSSGLEFTVYSYDKKELQQIDTGKVNIVEVVGGMKIILSMGESYLFNKLNKDLKAESPTFYIRVKSDTCALPVLDKVEISFLNTVSNKTIMGSMRQDDFSQLALQMTKLNNRDLLTEAENFIDKYSQLNLEMQSKENMLLRSGRYQVLEDLIFPDKVNVIIEKGTSIQLAPGKNIIVHGGLIIKGEADAPVTIDSIDDKPFGTFGVLGDNLTTVSISHLHVSNGFEAWHEGVHFTGSLSLYHHGEVRISNSSVSKGRADDGLNVKFVAHIAISDSRFADNFADQVDLDYVSGVVEGSDFSKQVSGDQNGDGLDVSGSNLLVRENIYSNFGDKGVNIGEDSRLFMKGNRFSNNVIAVAVKDSSVAYVNDNLFEANSLDYSVFRKKKIFDGGQLIISKLASNSLKIKVDRYSTMLDSPKEKIDLMEAQIFHLKDRSRHFVGFVKSNHH